MVTFPSVLKSPWDTVAPEVSPKLARSVARSVMFTLLSPLVSPETEGGGVGVLVGITGEVGNGVPEGTAPYWARMGYRVPVKEKFCNRNLGSLRVGSANSRLILSSMGHGHRNWAGWPLLPS